MRLVPIEQEIVIYRAHRICLMFFLLRFSRINKDIVFCAAFPLTTFGNSIRHTVTIHLGLNSVRCYK